MSTERPQKLGFIFLAFFVAVSYCHLSFACDPRKTTPIGRNREDVTDLCKKLDVAIQMTPLTCPFDLGLSNNQKKLIPASSQDVTKADDLLKKTISYIDNIKDTTDFKEDEAQGYIANLIKLSSNCSLDKAILARAVTSAGIITGRIADKEQSSDYGSLAYQLLKQATRIDETSLFPAEAWSYSLIAMSERGGIVRMFIQTALDINLSRERALCKAHLDTLTDSTATTLSAKIAAYDN